jgi:hypothetical protein
MSLATLVWIGMAVTAAPVAAMCALPNAALFPAAGTPLPAAPILYLFRPRRSWTPQPDSAEVTVRDATTGAAIDVRVRRQDRGGALDVFSVHVDTEQRVIEVSGPGFPTARYPVGNHDEHGRRHAVIERVDYRSHHWSCSFTEAVTVAGRGNVAAIGLEWLDGDQVHVAYLPPQLHALWRWDDDATLIERLGAPVSELVPPPIELSIGHVSCLGHIVDPAVLAREREVRLVAVFADGSREPLGAAPIRVHRIGMTVPRAWVGASIDRRATPTAATWPRPPTTAAAATAATASRRGPGWSVVGTLAIAIVVVVGALLRRRARTVVP